jgi:hypothetical protein
LPKLAHQDRHADEPGCPEMGVEPSRRDLITRSTSATRLQVIAYRVTLTSRGNWCTPFRSCWRTSGAAAGTLRGSRALTCFWQAVLGLR